MYTSFCSTILCTFQQRSSYFFTISACTFRYWRWRYDTISICEYRHDVWKTSIHRPITTSDGPMPSSKGLQHWIDQRSRGQQRASEFPSLPPLDRRPTRQQSAKTFSVSTKKLRPNARQDLDFGRARRPGALHLGSVGVSYTEIKIHDCISLRRKVTWPTYFTDNFYCIKIQEAHQQPQR